MRIRYALWIPVALRLLFPFSLGESPISVMNVLPADRTDMQHMQAGVIEHDMDRTDGYLNADDGEGVVDFEKKNSGVFGEGDTAFKKGGGDEVEDSGWRQRAEAGEGAAELRTDFWAEHSDLLRLAACGVWLFGFAAAGGYMLLSRQRFMRYLKNNGSLLSEEALPEDFAGRLSARGMKAYQVQGLPSPCLVGRDIYIGSRVADDRKSLPHILAHEYSHALHKDGLWAFLRSFLVAVYWFDPFVWAAAYAARQDSELACDEEAVALLGESERFAYGRTLLYLMKSGDSGDRCPGMAYMLDRGEEGVRERIGALTGTCRKKGAAAVPILLTVLMLCGCAFTGAIQSDAGSAAEETAAGGQGREDIDVQDAANQEADDEAYGLPDKEQVLKNTDKSAVVPVETKILSREEAKQAAFEEVLQYHGIMEGKDDSELALRRQVDYQTYFQYTKGEAENPMENGWYLLCENEDAGIAIYGLYTEEFGFRGLKTLIGEDVNTFDGKWCASYSNSADGNIRVLEQAQEGLPRRFVWKLPAEESGSTEIWRFYSANRYDTGSVEVKTLTEDDCLAWAKEYLTLNVNQEATKVYVTYDGDMYLGAIDISAYRDWKTEDVQIVPDAVSFGLDDPGSDIYAAYSDAVWEASVVYLAVGLKFEGVEGLWFDGLPLLTIQIAENENGASGFYLDYPRIDETYVANVLWQEKKLSALRDGMTSAQAAGSEETGKNDLEEPLVSAEAHHDLAIDFSNPCPAYEHISAWYGEGIDPATEKPRAHTGVDMAADEGADILAAADGKVFRTGFDAVNGNYVVLWHGLSGQMTYYAHCKTVEVAQGQQVAQGEKIATVGQTGQATGPCLHFAISSEDNWEEPYFLELE